jgi:RimJ/RimL family protein N-acetyltransferase
MLSPLVNDSVRCNHSGGVDAVVELTQSFKFIERQGVEYMGIIEPRSYTLRTGESIIVRSAQLGDAPALIEQTSAVMAEGAFMVTTSEEFNVTLEQEEEWIQSHTSDEGKILLVATDQDQVIGLLHFRNGVRRCLAHQGDFGMSVYKEWREQGVGSALVRSLIDWGCANPLIE